MKLDSKLAALEQQKKRGESVDRLGSLKIHESFGFELSFEGVPRMHWIVTKVPGGFIYQDNNPNASSAQSIFVPDPHQRRT